MPNDVDNDEEQKTIDEIEARIEKQLSGIKDNIDESKKLALIVGDPDVQKILKAKQEGKGVQVTLAGDIPKEEEIEVEEEDVDLDTLSNTELTRHIVKSLEKSVSKVMSSKMKEFNESIGGLKGHVEMTQRAAIDQKIAEARDKYSDFDDYVEDIVKLASTAPGLDPMELYEIAVRRKGGTPTLKIVETERPSSSSSRPTSKPTRKEPLPGGAKGFKTILKEALESKKIDSILEGLPDNG